LTLEMLVCYGETWGAKLFSNSAELIHSRTRPGGQELNVILRSDYEVPTCISGSPTRTGHAG